MHHCKQKVRRRCHRRQVEFKQGWNGSRSGFGLFALTLSRSHTEVTTAPSGVYCFVGNFANTFCKTKAERLRNGKGLVFVSLSTKILIT